MRWVSHIPTNYEKCFHGHSSICSRLQYASLTLLQWNPAPFLATRYVCLKTVHSLPTFHWFNFSSAISSPYAFPHTPISRKTLSLRFPYVKSCRYASLTCFNGILPLSCKSFLACLAWKSVSLVSSNGLSCAVYLFLNLRIERFHGRQFVLQLSE